MQLWVQDVGSTKEHSPLSKGVLCQGLKNRSTRVTRIRDQSPPTGVGLKALETKQSLAT